MNLKDLADNILKLSSQYSVDPSTLRFFLDSGIYRENAEKRLEEILNNQIEDQDKAPSSMQFKSAVLIVTQVLEKEDQDELLLSQSERWLFKD